MNKSIRFTVAVVLAALIILVFLSGPVLARSIERNDFGPQAVEINFDDLPSGTFVGDLYLSSGVSFNNAVAVAGSYPVSYPNVITSSDGLPISIHFPTGVIRVGISIDTDGYNLGRQPQMRAFDKNGNLLGIQDFGQGPDFVVLEFPGTLIAAIQLGSTNSSDQTEPFFFSDAYDNLKFEKGENISLSAADTTISPDRQTNLTVSVTENGTPVANEKVKVEVQVTDGSGGHQHSDINRPRGCLTYNGSESLLMADNPSIDVTTDSAGEAHVIFKPGKDIGKGCKGHGIAGNYEVTARLTDSPSTFDRQIIVAKVTGLEPLPLYSANYVITGQTSTHPVNNWATPTTNQKILALAADFKNVQDKLNAVLEGCGKPTWSIQQLSVNDMSLPGGGLFDVGNSPWQPPHQAHEQGYSVDFNRWDYPDTPLQFACEHDRTISQRWWLLSTLVSLGRKYGTFNSAEMAERPPRYHLEIKQSTLSPTYLHMQGERPDLSVTLLPMAPEYLALAPGQMVTYAIEVSNMNGTVDANNAFLSVTLPAALSLESADPPPSSGTNSQPKWEIGKIEAGALPQIVTLQAKVNTNVVPGTEFTTAAQVSGTEPDLNPADNQTEFTLSSYLLGADLNVSSEIEPTEITHDQTSIFAISVANYGNSDAPGTVLTLTVPSQIEVLSTNPMYTSYEANTITWQLGNLPVNQELPVTVTFYTPPNIAVGSLLTYTLQSISEAPDINVDDNSMQVTYKVKQTGVDAGVIIDVTGIHEDGNFSVGETITYTIYYGNYGNQVPTSSSQIDFHLGDGLVLLSANPHDSSVISDTISENGGTWYIPNLPIDSFDYIEVIAQVTSIPDGGSLAYAMISQRQDINMTNNVAYELRFEHLDNIYLPIILR